MAQKLHRPRAEQLSMLIELGARFLLGGLIVTAFAVLGDILQPKSFAGIFGAAPSIALATLGLTFAAHGGTYTGLEGRSMLAGAAAFFIYSAIASRLLLRRTAGALAVSATTLLTWLMVAFGLWALWLR